jgi:NDMA-dependent alcohol dehydrogenase
MTTAQAAVNWSTDQSWSIETVEVDPPRQGEVLVRMIAAGVCHSDALLTSGGYPGIRRPIIGGHEGAGIVEAVGPGTSLVALGDHVVTCVPAPPCGHCDACSRAWPHLCEQGAYISEGFAISDHRPRHHARGEDLGTFVLLGTFAERTVVHELSCARIDPSIPFELACVIGCAGVTGWGAAQNTAGVGPGDVAVVVGIGGVGACALQGAAFAGAKDVVAVEPVAWKRELAARFGAGHAVASLELAYPYLRDLTYGRMADQVIMTMGEGDGRLLHDALRLCGKRGRLVVVNVHPEDEMTATVNLRDLQSYEKQIVGCLSGSWHGRRGVPFLADLYQRGRLNLADLVTSRYSLTQLPEAVRDQAEGRVLRAVITFPYP